METATIPLNMSKLTTNCIDYSLQQTLDNEILQRILKERKERAVNIHNIRKQLKPIYKYRR